MSLDCRLNWHTTDRRTDAWEQWGPQQDINTLKVMNTVLDAESPQLVVLNGDLTTGENVFLENSTDYVDMLVEPMAKRKVPWTSTYGNHDSNFNISREGILARERTYPHAMTDQMVFSPNAGVSNYWLPVFPHDHADEPCLFLWFFDSRGGSYFQQGDIAGKHIEQPNWVDEYVVEWFKSFNDWLVKRHGRVIPSLAFVHIPTNASRVYQTEVGPRPHYEPGINDDYPLAQQSQGWCADGSHNGTCVYGGQDLPFMKAIAETPGLIALFSGHDHGDSWCFKWDSALPAMDFAGKGVNVCFGQHTGYGGYGRWIRGARQILVTQEMLKHGEVGTWIRLEDQSVVGSVTLNSTYGRDWYDKTPNKHTKCPTCE